MLSSPLKYYSGPIFALLFCIAFVSWILPDLIAWRAKRSPDLAQARDMGSLNLIAVLWWAAIAMDFSLSFLLPQAALLWKPLPLFCVGIGAMLLGIALRWCSARLL